MDDIRRPQHLKRRDYAIPSHRPVVPHPQHPQQPIHPNHHPTPPNHSQTAGQHHYYQQPQPAAFPQYHQPQPAPIHHPPQSHHQPIVAPATKTHRKRLKLTTKHLSIIVGIIVAVAAVFGAGYLLKGSSDSKGIPASITRQVNYDLFFPAPMPPGYIYMKDSATFQIGQVFYKFANGKKRVTVNEQPMPDPKPDLSKLAGYTQFNSPVGPAAIGTEVSEPIAVILTPTTVITMHCIGGVSPDELKTAINNLKNIGQKPNNG